METNNLLNELDSDRQSLAQRVRTPWWLAAGFGLIAASFVVIPAFDGNSTGVLISAIVLSIALVASYQRATGVKIGKLGVGSWLLVIAAILVVLALYSVSLGLASMGLNAWVAAPTIVAFALGATLVVVFTLIARGRMRRVG